jgi:aryl-alcohol dehydrogenase-like predicted oxidoreductase
MASVSAGVDLFDTAALYSGGASERRVRELAEGRRVVIATKFISYRHLTIAAAYHWGVGWSRSMVSAAVTGS